MKLAAQRAKRIVAFIERAKAVPDLADEASKLIQMLKPPPSRPMTFRGPTRDQDRQARRLGQRMSTAAVYRAVDARAAGVCEACRKRWGFRGAQMDHFYGGSGRRKQMEAVETCWKLCVPCHSEKSANSPNVAFWNGRFEEHCERHGYEFKPLIEHAPVPRPALPAANEAPAEPMSDPAPTVLIGSDQ